MKGLMKVVALLVLVAIVAGCGAQATEAPEGTELTAAEQWAKDNGFGPYQPAEEDWAAIEAAAKKEGKVVVYCNSSKFEKLLESWNELYPDIALEGGDTDDIATKMSSEQQAGNVVGDVWYNSDGHLLYGEFVPNQWLWSYVPTGLKVEDVTADRPFAVVRHGVDVIGYNQEIRPEGCPLTNWWQLTEPELEGKFFMEDPAADASTTAKISLIVQHADDMAEAYQALYSKEWTTDADYGTDTTNAGYLFLKKLAKNKPGLQPGGDEVDAAFATLGMDASVEPGYGWTGLSSLETTLDGELAMAPCYGLQPVVGILKSTYLAVANGSTHPNAAKLFIKFALSPEGIDPWNRIGNYPTVEGIELPEGMPARGELELWPSDDFFSYQNNSQIRDFWLANLLGK
ncbi:MAG TPA: extracellular solute-binding protein [Anaerolineae bacterium]|nr:extracellular solute-binding protein [Anaerolineae bacterium]